MKIKFKKFSALGQVPKKETYGSACFDAYSSTEVTLRPGQTEQILLDIGFQFSKKVCCRIYPRSGLSLLPAFVGMVFIDSDYRGKISVILTNFPASNVDVKIGDRIAQIMFIKPEVVTSEEFNNFTDDTVRNTRGFWLRIHLMFIIMICESSFASYFVTIYVIAL